MFYCDNCRNLYEEEVCPDCGKKLRKPYDDDPCFLVEEKELYASMLKEVLENHNIPYYSVSAMGAGFALRVGPLLETYQFFVPYAYLNQAKECVSQIFGQNG